MILNSWTAIRRWMIWRDDRGQDLIEYALFAGFLALVAGLMVPTQQNSVFSSVARIMGEVNAVAANAIDNVGGH